MSQSKINKITEKLKQCEIQALKIKAINFTNFQSFNFVHSNYDVGEIYHLKGIGYTVITNKTDFSIDWVVIMKPNAIWLEHWQDVDKHIQIKQGIYLDLYTGIEYKNKIDVKAFEPSYFKSIGTEDLVLKGTVTKKQNKIA